MVARVSDEAFDKVSANETSVNPFTQHLLQLTIIRSLVLGVLWSVFLTSLWFHAIELPYRHIGFILVVMSLIQGVTFVRIKSASPVSGLEFFVQLLLDVFCFNCLFYFSGGATNPFISYLLVPVCISAATLPWRYTWLMTALCILAYTFLLFYHLPLPIFSMTHENMNSRINWHILGMWFNFFVSAILITYFVVKMAKGLRLQEEALNQLKEDELRNEQVFALAALAAGAAHEINTPLATMTVLLSELRDEYASNAALLLDLNVLSEQVTHCATSLKQMVHNASIESVGEYKKQELKAYCSAIVDRWQLMRPSVRFSLEFVELLPQWYIRYDSRLDQALINLLNNAADASPDKVVVRVSVKAAELSFTIIDEGEGIHNALTPVLGKKPITTKTFGLGIGLLLSHATLKHYGGRVIQIPNTPKGTITDIRLPLDAH
jgi:two-component system, sensor histidine kinase RegB